MMRFALIIALTWLMHAARSFDSVEISGSSGTASSFGYLLLVAFLVGGIFQMLRLPRLTGYILTGIVAGPNVTGLITQGAVDNLKLFTGVAVALIALTAGTELEFKVMRPLMRTIAWLTAIAVLGTALLLSAAAYLARDLLPFMHDFTLAQSISVACVLGVVMSAQSPAVVVALRKELNADGPLTRTVLGVVVIADLVVILLFALASTLAKASFGKSADAAGTLSMLAFEILGSLVAGTLVGVLISIYVRYVKGGTPLFILTVCFVVAEVGQRVHLDPLIVALAAGVFIRNLTDLGALVHDAIESSSLPVYVVFFSIAGATIHIDALAVLWAPAILFVCVRAFGFLSGSRMATSLAASPDVVRRFVGYGLLPQAGLALALSMLFAKAFPEFGSTAGALTLSVVAINEIVAPALYRLAIVRSGEADKGSLIADSPPGSSAPSTT